MKAALGEEYFDYSGGANVNPPFSSKLVTPDYSVSFAKGADDVAGALDKAAPYKEGAVVTLPVSKITRRGYDFAGWLADTDGRTYAAGSTYTMTASDVLFTAQWNAKAPFEISTEQQLREHVAAINAGTEDSAGVTYKITKDITLTSDWTPICAGSTSSFKGTIDGGGHVIKNMKVSVDDARVTCVGFIGKAEGATIKNLGVEGSVTAPQSTCAGGLVGLMGGSDANGSTPAYYGTIDNCFARVAVQAFGKKDSYAGVGGLAGYVIRSSVSNSYATGTVAVADATAAAGGLIGAYFLPQKYSASPVVSNVYAAGTVSSTAEGAQLGSLVGYIEAVDAAKSPVAGTAWGRLSNVHVLASDLDAYKIKTGNRYTSCGEPVNTALGLDVAALKGAAGKLGSAFAADSSVPANGGYPVLLWEQEEVQPQPDPQPQPSILNIMMSPYDATLTVTDGEGEAISPTRTVDMKDSGSDEIAYRAYTFQTYHTKSYTVTAAKDGYESVIWTKETEKSRYSKSHTIELKKNAEPVGPADATALQAGIATAQAALQGVSVSPDGRDVAPSAQWVTAAVKDALASAIETARGVASKTGVTQTELDSAKNALEAALATFNAAKKAGTKQPATPGGGSGGTGGGTGGSTTPSTPVDKTGLAAAVEKAQATLANTVESKDGTDVTTDRSWASAEAIAEFKKQLESAQKVAANSSATASQVKQALEALEKAAETFSKAAKPGTKRATSAASALLGEALAAARAALAGVVESADGSDVHESALWVTPANARLMRDHIASMQRVFDDPDASAEELTAAIESIQSMTSAFGVSAKSGLKKTEVQPEANAAASTKGTANVAKLTAKALKKALGKNAGTVTRLTLGKKVGALSKGMFKGTKVKTLVLKTTKLTKKSVKGALANSKVKTLKVQVSKSKKTNEKWAKKYRAFFSKKNCGKTVTVKAA